MSHDHMSYPNVSLHIILLRKFGKTNNYENTYPNLRRGLKLDGRVCKLNINTYHQLSEVQFLVTEGINRVVCFLVPIENFWCPKIREKLQPCYLDNGCNIGVHGVSTEHRLCKCLPRIATAQV